MPYSKEKYSTEKNKPAVPPWKQKFLTGRDWFGFYLGGLFLALLWHASRGAISVLFWVIGILGFLLITTFIIKVFVKSAKTWYLFSMLETKRFNPVFDKLKNAKWIETASELGAIIGYGAIGVDYFYGRKLKGWKRIAVFVASIIVLGWIFGLLFGNLSNNPLVKGPGWLYQFFFGFFGLAGFLLLALFTQGIDGLFKIFAGKAACPGVAPIIPGVQTPNVPLYVPIEAWISLFAILVIHEASHGFLVRRHNVKLESSGLLLAGLLPIGAFVKPDEKAMAKIEKRKQVQIMSAGPSSNLYSFIVIGILMAGMTQFVFNPVLGPMSQEIQRNSSLGVKIAAVDQNIQLCGETVPSPAYGEIEPGSKLLAVDDKNVLSLNDASQFLRNKPSEPKKLLLDMNGTITEKTLTANALGRFGIQLENIPNNDYQPPANKKQLLEIFQLFASIVGWFVTLSLFVAIANFLPADPLDGGRIAKYMLAPYFGFLKMSEEDTERFVGRLFLWILIPLIILNALPIIL